MTKRIGVIITTLLAAGAIGLTGPASASSPAREITSVKCDWACLDVFQPVTCEMSDGITRTFSNRCYGEVFACQHGLTIISCRAQPD